MSFPALYPIPRRRKRPIPAKARERDRPIPAEAGISAPQGAKFPPKIYLHSAKKKLHFFGIFVYNCKSVRRGAILSIKEHLYEKLHFYDSPPVRGGFWRD